MVVKSFCTSTLLRVLTPLISRDSVTGTAAKTRRVRYESWLYLSTCSILTQTVHNCGAHQATAAIALNIPIENRSFDSIQRRRHHRPSQNDWGKTQRIHSDDNQYNNPTGTIQKVHQSSIHYIFPSILPPLPFYNTEGTYHPLHIRLPENIDSRNNSMADITILLGLTGGCDSMALLYKLQELLLSSAVGRSWLLDKIQFEKQHFIGISL